MKKGNNNCSSTAFTIKDVHFSSRIFTPEDIALGVDLNHYVYNRLSDSVMNSIQSCSYQCEDLINIHKLYVEAAEAAVASDKSFIHMSIETGTILGSLISPATNCRRDQYGGTLHNRLIYPTKIIKSIQQYIDNRHVFVLKLSGAEFISNGYTVEDGISIARNYDSMADVLYISAGIDFTKDSFIREFPHFGIASASNIRLASEIKTYINSPVATAYALKDQRLINGILKSGKVDFIYTPV